MLLVGTGQHADSSELPAIPAVERSLTALAESLGASDIEVLPDPASPLEFGRAVTKAAAEATDTLLVYYVGHGLVGPDGLYLATRATDGADSLPYTALPYSAVRQAVQNSSARTIAVILDCCFSGRAETPAGPAAQAAVLEQTLVRGGFLLASTAQGELGLAPPGAEYTAFTGALIKLLRDGDPTGPQQLTLDHAYRYLVRALPEEGAPRPHRYTSDQAGELVLARNPAYQARPASTVDPPDHEAPCPFRGLSPYGPEDARFFFGREEIITQVTSHVISGGLVTVVGASGCGKTSLLRAGVVTALEALPGKWTVAAMTPGTDPRRALADRVAALADCESPVLLVDQFEELFTADIAEDEREAFIQELAEVAGSVVVAVRADFYEACTRYPTLVRRQVVVGPMGMDELRAVIEQPARVAGLRLADGLTDTILRAVRTRHRGEESAVLPYLSHALLATWQQRSGNLLTLDSYRSTGGIEEAIARTAEEAYAQAEDQAEVRALMLRLVRLGDGVEDTRRRLPLADLADSGVVGILAAARLVTVDEDAVEIAHEALLYAWPRLRSWIDEDRATLLAVQQVTDAARAWEQAGQQDTDLYDGPRLEAAKRAVQGHAIGPTVRMFVDRSIHVRRRQARTRRRQRWRRRLLLVAVIVLAAVLTTVSVIFVRASNEAERKAAVVRSGQLAAYANSLRSTNPSLAAQLAIAAYRSAPTQDAASQLYASAATPLDGAIANTDTPVVRVATQPDGPLAVAGGENGSLRIWNLTNPATPALTARIQAGGSAVAIGPGGKVLAGGCPGEGALCLWDITNPTSPARVAQLPAQASSVAISADGTLLAAAAQEGITRLWSIARPAEPKLLATLPNPTKSGPSPAAVAFSPTQPVLAQTIQGGGTTLWNFTDPAKPAQITSHPVGYQAIAFNRTGTMLAAAGRKAVGLWRVDKNLVPIKVDPPGPMLSLDLMAVALSPDGTRLAFSGENPRSAASALGLLDLSTGDLAFTLPATTNTAYGTATMAYTASGDLLAGGRDGVVRLWRSALPQASGGLASNGSQWTLGPDGRLMVTRMKDRSLGIWDIASARQVASVPVNAPLVQFLNPSALLTVSDLGAVQLWNVHDPQRPVAELGLATHKGAVHSFQGVVTVNNAGDVVAVLGEDARLHLWRVTDLRAATEVGSVPADNAANGPAGVLSDGRTAFLGTSDGLEWWNISDPARPVRGELSKLKDANKGAGASTGSVFAAAAPPAKGPTPLNVFDVADGVVRGRSTLTPKIGGRLALSNDSRLLAGTSPDNSGLTLWDVTDPRQPRQTSTFLTGLAITGIEFAPAGNRMAVWSTKALQLWDVSDTAAPKLVADVIRPGTKFSTQADVIIDDVKFSPAGGMVAAATLGGTVLMFDDSPETLANRLCAYVGIPMKPEEWQQYAPGVPYSVPCGG